MAAQHSIFGIIVELIDAGTPLAVALVLSAKGSTPQGAGARAIIEQSGRLWGTVGGGMFEAQTLRRPAKLVEPNVRVSSTSR